MKDEYAGVLPTTDPLYDFLAEEVLHQILGFECDTPVFDVYTMDHNSAVFRYADRRTFTNLICKFYGRKLRDGAPDNAREMGAAWMRREFDNLQRVRALGMDGRPHLVVRPLAMNEALDCVLVEDFVPGTELGSFIREAIGSGEEEELRARLADVAWFLANLHNRSQSDQLVPAEHGLDYLDKVVEQLGDSDIISEAQRERLVALRDRWAAAGLLGGVRQVWMHGDATPGNFLLTGDHNVAVIDLERLWPGDRAVDVGYMAGELQHTFYQSTGDPEAAEPYIQHFYADYAGYLCGSDDDLATLTSRGRFYMGCSLLRISRNAWLDLDYRQRLVEEAERCLNL